VWREGGREGIHHPREEDEGIQIKGRKKRRKLGMARGRLATMRPEAATENKKKENNQTQKAGNRGLGWEVGRRRRHLFASSLLSSFPCLVQTMPLPLAQLLHNLHDAVNAYPALTSVLFPHTNRPWPLVFRLQRRRRRAFKKQNLQPVSKHHPSPPHALHHHTETKRRSSLWR
jgi:hypothetical protein